MQRAFVTRCELGAGACLGLALVAVLSACSPAVRHERRQYVDLAAASAGATVRNGQAESEAGGSRGAARLVGDGRLFIPAGAEIEHLLDLRSETSWTSDRVEVRGTGPLELQLHVETDEAGAREVSVLSATGGEAEVDLGLAEATPARLFMRVSGSAEADAGVLLVNPGLAAPFETDGSPREGLERRGRPNVIVYLVDTLRVDRLGCYGYEKPISPAIDAFASQAVVFENAVGQSSWTRSSVVSVFTGVWPVSHGTIGARDKLTESLPTLAERLSAEGYRSAALVANDGLDARFGVGRGFETYKRIRKRRASRHVTARALEWLGEQDEDQPLFLYVHTVDPHSKYEPRREYLERFAPDSSEFLETTRIHPRSRNWPVDPETRKHLSALYDAEIAQNDAAFGRFIEGLKALGLFEGSLIVFLSDHGEEFLEHGSYTHGDNLHTTTLDVPLIVKFPHQRAGFRSGRLVQHADLMPTLLELAGSEPPPSVEGQSFVELAKGPAKEAAKHRVFSYLDLGEGRHASLVEADWKLILTETSEGERRQLLFNRARDRGEARDLSAELPIRTAVMSARLEAQILSSRSRASRESIELDEDLEQSLRALGYL